MILILEFGSLWGKTTVCTYFILHNISNLFKSFAEIHQASMTDHITGLFAQNVLVKKICGSDFTINYGLTSKENPDEDIQLTINRAHAIMFNNKIESSIHRF